MKKIIKLGIALFILVSVVACGSKVDDEAIDAYVAASQNMINMKTADYSVTVNAEVEDTVIGIKAYGAYDARSDMKLNMMIDMDFMGSGFMNIGEMYINDYVIYMNEAGEKEAVNFKEYASILSYLFESTSSQIDRDKVKEMFTSAELKDGHLILTADTESLGIEEQLNDSLGAGSGIDMKLSEMKFDVTLENNFMTNIVVDAVMTFSDSGTSSTMNFHMTMGFTNINSDRTIKFPDFSDYKVVESLGIEDGLSGEVY